MFKTIFSKQKINDDEKRVINIPINLIKPNPYQPRKKFDKSSMDELCESIKSYGIIQPITVRSMPNSTYELVAGERRMRAAKIAGIKQIPAIITDITDDDSAILAIVENSHREQLNFIEEAEAYYNLINKHKISQSDLANKIGKSQSTISNKIQLLKLSPIVRKIIILNGLSEGHAKALLRVEDENLIFKVLQVVCEKKLSVSKMEELIDKIANKDDTCQSPKKKFFGVYKDLRIFVNTIHEAVQIMNKSGIEASASQKEDNECLEFNIVIKKSKK